MALLKDKDDLSQLKGLAMEAFESQRLAYLQTRFLASQPAEAIDLLASFYRAAEDLRDNEDQFRNRQFNARAKRGGPDLKVNLRDPEHFAAIKTFRDARSSLLDMDSAVASQIVTLVEKSINAKPRSAKRAFTG
jgi:hypothetical protein